MVQGNRVRKSVVYSRRGRKVVFIKSIESHVRDVNLGGLPRLRLSQSSNHVSSHDRGLPSIVLDCIHSLKNFDARA